MISFTRAPGGACQLEKSVDRNFIWYPGNKFNDRAIASRKRKPERDAAVGDGLIALAFRVARVSLLPIRCSYLGSAFLLCV